MIKVYVGRFVDEKYHKDLEAVSDKYEFVYEEDKEAEVVLGGVVVAHLKDFKNLKWFQSAAVGIDAYIKKGVLPEGAILTNARDVHTVEVAEHTLACLMAMVKRLYQYRDNQIEQCWHDEGMVKEYRDLKVCIVGLGDIGKHLAKLCKALGMYVIGVKRSAIVKPDYVDELYLNKDLDKAISDVDAVVTVIPGNEENRHLFTVDTFRKMRPDAVMINVGRGNLYSEETLVEVLDKKIIAAVASDVFEKEPLDSQSKLWDYRNMIITPHIAGSYHLESAKERFAELCKENLKRYIEGRELLNIVKEREE